MGNILACSLSPGSPGRYSLPYVSTGPFPLVCLGGILPSLSSVGFTETVFFFSFPYCCRPAEWGNAFCQSPNTLWWTVAPTEIIHQALTACFFITILFISSIYFGLELFCAFECGVCILEGEQLHTSFKELMKCRKSGDQPVPELCLESPNLAVSCKAICFLGAFWILFYFLSY